MADTPNATYEKAKEDFLKDFHVTFDSNPELFLQFYQIKLLEIIVENMKPADQG